MIQKTYLTLFILFFSCKLFSDTSQSMPRFNHSTEVPQADNIKVQTDEGQWSLFLQGSYLYWEPQEDNLYYTVESIGVAPPTIAKPLFIDTSKKSGYRVGGAISTPLYDWSLSAQYTSMHSRDRSSASVADPLTQAFAFLSWFTTGNITTGDQVSALWDLDYDMIDFGISQTYHIGKDLTLSAFYGGKTGWIDQKFDINFHISNQAVGQNVVSNTTTTSYGIGPQVGLDMNWLLGKGFHIFGNLSQSILVTWYKIDHVETNAANVTQVFVTSTNKPHAIRPIAEMLAGLGWSTYFYNNKAHFDVLAGYEVQILWNQNMLAEMANVGGRAILANGGDLSFHGWTFQARLVF